MNNIQKAFKTKSKLRGMADGGQVDPNILGSGMAQRSGAALQGRRAQIDDIVDAAVRGEAPPKTPNPITAAPAKKPEEKSALRSFFGFADGGQIFKNDVGGVPTFTDAKAATAGAKAYTPGSSGGGTFSVIGMEPAQRQQMQEQAAQRQAAANAPTTLGGRLDAALGKINSPLQTAGQSGGSNITLGGELDAALKRTQGVTSPATPDASTPANDPNRIMNSRDMSIFSPGERKQFSSMSAGANATAAQATDVGLSAGKTPGIPVDTAYPSQVQQDYNDFFAFADGGKVKGSGGPTDDKVGPVMLSHGEYVLPADTVDIVGRDKLDALRLATHDFVDDGNKPKVSSLRKMANGGPVTSGISVEELNDPASRRAFRQARVAASMGNHFGAQTILNDAIPRHRFAPEPPPAAPPKPPTEPPRPQAAGGTPAKAASRFGTATRAVGNALLPATAAYDAYTDSPEARNRAASGQDGLAGVASQVGSYLGSALAAGTSSPQDIGAMTSALRGEGTGAYHAVPDAEKGWARRLGDKYLPTQSAEIMAGGVQLPPAMQARVDALKRSGFDVGNMTDDDFTRARRQGLAEAAPPGAHSRASFNDAMGNLRHGKEPGGGFAQTNVPGIFGRKSSDPKKHLGEYIGVGKPAPQEDPIMGEIRSALRGLTEGAGNRGGWAPSSNARDINARYDKLASQLSGMYSKKGQGNLARRLLELEQSRSGALDADARNQSALRGQDMQASTAADNASMQARMQALQTLGTLAGRRAEPPKSEKPADFSTTLKDTAGIFSGGDDAKQAALTEKLFTGLSEGDRKVLEGMPADEQVTYLSQLLRQDAVGRSGELSGVDHGAAMGNAAVGAAVGGAGTLATRRTVGASKLRNAGKMVDKVLGKVPRIGKVVSALRPAERLAQLTASGVLPPVGGAAYGYTTTPDSGTTPENALASIPLDSMGNPIGLPDERGYLANARQYGMIDALPILGTLGGKVYNSHGVLVDDPRLGPQASEYATMLRRLATARNRAMQESDQW